jgi:hypothetical protein
MSRTPLIDQLFDEFRHRLANTQTILNPDEETVVRNIFLSGMTSFVMLITQAAAEESPKKGMMLLNQCRDELILYCNACQSQGTKSCQAH